MLKGRWKHLKREVTTSPKTPVSKWLRVMLSTCPAPVAIYLVITKVRVLPSTNLIGSLLSILVVYAFLYTVFIDPILRTLEERLKLRTILLILFLGGGITLSLYAASADLARDASGFPIAATIYGLVALITRGIMRSLRPESVAPKKAGENDA